MLHLRPCCSLRGLIMKGDQGLPITSQGSHARPQQRSQAEVAWRHLWRVRPEAVRSHLQPWRPAARPSTSRVRPCSRILTGRCLTGSLLCQGTEESAGQKPEGGNEPGRAAGRKPCLEDRRPPGPAQVLSFRLVSMVRSRRAGRTRSAAPRRPAPHRRKGERRAGGEMDGAGREELGEDCRAARRREQPRGSGMAARRGAESGGGVSVRTGRPTSTPLPAGRNGSARGGMRCSAQRTGAGGMNHPTLGEGCALPCRPSAAGGGGGGGPGLPSAAGAERPGTGPAAPEAGGRGLREAGQRPRGLSLLPPRPPRRGRPGRGLSTAGWAGAGQARVPRG